MAQQLHKAVLAGSAPTIHLFRFPKITINHGLLLFGLTESEREIRFDAYDPNLANHPVTLIYDCASRRFFFPPAIYWAGGPVNVVQIYRGGLYRYMRHPSYTGLLLAFLAIGLKERNWIACIAVIAPIDR